ncbi:hypothetical protein DPMN_047530 [Dreissena polymorpha]|uniref:Uncharacterized protein n=1 Tax=Dreissena polymorpha TaxID=45954 RepID=A0A9D4D880_DREPO|nr:hypothetical protein DPMN_047530 [Dreissena polymorpha]
MFHGVDKRLNRFVEYLMKQGNKCLRLKKTEVSQTNLILVTMDLSLIVLMSGAVAYVHFQGCAYIDAL